MLINGVELSALGVQLHNRIITSNSIETTHDWLDGDVQPTFVRQQDKFKNIKLQFLITEKNEEDAFVIMSNLTMLLKKASIKFDDMTLQFDVALVGQTTQERLRNGNFIFTVNLESDYAKGAGEVYTTDTAATDAFNLTVMYYRDTNTLISSDTVTIRSIDFTNNDNVTFETLGIDINKYQPEYYNKGKLTNFSSGEISYEALKNLQVLFINYAPTVYSRTVEYYLNDGLVYNLIDTVVVSFTKEKVDNSTVIGQLIDLNLNRPNGYAATTNFNDKLTFENLMAFNGTLSVYFDIIPDERTKEVKIHYLAEHNGSMESVYEQTLVVSEGRVVDGTKIGDLFNSNGYKPDKYYKDGVLDRVDEVKLDTLVTFDTIESEYTIKYELIESPVYVEYYYGEYPSWNRHNTELYKFKHQTEYDTAENIITALKIDLNKFANDLYESGVLYNADLYHSYDDIINAGVLQIYYKPKVYTLTVNYFQDNDTGEELVNLGTKDFEINDLMFKAEPTLSEIININAYRPDGFKYDTNSSYNGEVSLTALLAASPITIVYKPVAVVHTKSIVVRYKKELSSTYAVINTSILTIEEAAVGGGIKLSQLFEINKYKPDYYNNGIVDGYATEAVFTFEELEGSYDVLYMAETYSTQVRYYTDEITNSNWVGSASITYTLLDFETDTTLTDLGLDINLFKPSYCGDGEVQYFGAVNFGNLINLDYIAVLYVSEKEPDDDSGIDYPHRILFLQHNDMGAYEPSFPTWTLNHAYINTGVTAADMSKLTVSCDVFRVFETEPLYNVNVGSAYLFGSSTPNGSYYIKYVNNTKYTNNATGINTFNIMAGNGTPELVIEEDSSNGFSANTGIYASERDGYSYATLTYSNLVQSNSAKMVVPLFLFACDTNGYYTGGIAGVGIKSCKIYYDNVLIRDFVPVQYFDKIGSQIAPSNCLYDKVTQTFFEDATGKNSFNIMDDPDYVDTNPEHNIGKCYAKYYKNGGFFQTVTYYFRESQFVNGAVWDPEEELYIDYYQPEFYGSGVITNLSELGGVTFNNVNGFIFEINYPLTGYNVTVNYWKDNMDSADNLIATEQVPLKETMFYQVPTFGDLVKINKYKPVGYIANYPYPESKVTLKRLLANAPYNIIYTPVETTETVSFTVKYYKKKFGINIKDPIKEYEFIGSKEIILDNTDIVDGVYPEDFIDFNLMKPAEFYNDGIPFEWYLKDENLGLENIQMKSEYIVVYQPTPQYVPINYYTDEVAEENLIASQTWEIKIDDWSFGTEFTLVDELPNNYINQFKPIICDGGILQDSDKIYTFETLAKSVLSIVYMTREEPHDPENDLFPSKVIWWTDSLNWSEHEARTTTAPYIQNAKAPYVPYLNLGYIPKEIQRLRMEVKAYSLGNNVSDYDYYPNSETGYAASTPWKYESDCFSYFLGYIGADYNQHINILKQNIGASDCWESCLNALPANKPSHFNFDEEDGLKTPKPTSMGAGATGWFAFRGHIVYANGFSKQFDDFCAIDGDENMIWNNNAQAFVGSTECQLENKKGAFCGYRFGKYLQVDENYHTFVENHNHYAWDWQKDKEGHGSKSFSNHYEKEWASTGTLYQNGYSHFFSEGKWGPFTVFHPYTMIMDAYHGFIQIYDASNSNDPLNWNQDHSKDLNLFADRCSPKGPITLFLTTNPDTGKVNMLLDTPPVYVWMKHYKKPITGTTGGKDDEDTTNPEGGGATGGGDGSGSGGGTGGSAGGSTGTGTGGSGSQIEIHGGLFEMAYNPYTTEMDCPWGNLRVTPFPDVKRTMVWYIKIWDRDRLVRNLIPVAEGDQIYDYVAPANGMFDTVTETFFTNANEGGTYKYTALIDSSYGERTLVVKPEEVFPLRVNDDPTIYGKITVNYYDHHNEFLGNQYCTVPTDYFPDNISFKDILLYNDMKPSNHFHDGIIDTDVEGIETDIPSRTKLKEVYDSGSINVYYKQIQYAKTVVYYAGNNRIGSKDFFFSQEEIENANTLADLGIDPDLYKTDLFKPGRIMSDESIIASDDVEAFIDAPSPIVVYDKWTKEERPELFYYEYYRGGAYEPEGQETLTVNSDNPNYLDCELDARVLNPAGCIKYLKHYHSALREDEQFDYFIAYQVDVKANYVPVHKGPARAYKLLATIVDNGRYTVIEENRGWGRLKEYPNGWILLKYTEKVAGPGQNPDYDVPDPVTAVTIPFGTRLTINKMTIDRLWAYSPEYASWIKTEEISFDQSGRLYNAIAGGAIDLSKVDFTKITQFSDLVDPQAYAMRFHDDCPFVYDGALTQEALSELHSVDFVYPETVYPYVVKYYKNTLDDSNVLGREAFSCSLSDWNPDWDIFIETSWKKDDEGNTINPTLYRSGVPLDLDWDFFDIPVNKHKPDDSYQDGLMLWNPRTYNHGKVVFNFEELITTGVQNILYIPNMNMNYKLKFSQGFIQLPTGDMLDPKLYDIEFKAQNLAAPLDSFATTTFIRGLRKFEEADSLPADFNNFASMARGHYYNNIIKMYTEHGITYVSLQYPGIIGRSPYFVGLSNNIGNITKNNWIMQEEDDQYTIINISGKRKGTDKSIAIYKGNDLTGTQNSSPIFAYDNDNRTTIKNVALYVGAGKISVTDTSPGARYEVSANGDFLWYYIKIYKNFYLEHYYIPLPKGAWLPNGGQMPEVGFYDLITQTVHTTVKNYSLSISLPSYVQKVNYSISGNKAPLAYQLGKNPSGEPSDFFEGWTFNSTDVQYIGQTNANVTIYTHPDVLAQVVATTGTNTILPITKETSDSANKVIGTWYFVGSGWVKADAVNLLPSGSYNIEYTTRTVTLKGDTTNTATTYYSYLGPDETTVSNYAGNKFTTEQRTTIYAECNDFYYTKYGWVPAAYTDDNIVENTNIYIVAIESINVYKYPIILDAYKVSNKLLGDRLQAVSNLVKDPLWINIGPNQWVYNQDGHLTILEQ